MEIVGSEYGKDDRVSVVMVGPATAGPFYNHGRARNIGAQAARHEVLMFMDADVYASRPLIAEVNLTMSTEEDDNLRADILAACVLKPKQKQLPTNYLDMLPDKWEQDGQIAVRNATFLGINGFHEACPHWGFETYDLLLRAQELTSRIARFKLTEKWAYFHIDKHADALRDKYLSARFSGSKQVGKDGEFDKARKFYSSQRVLSYRAQPGKLLGLSTPTSDVRIVHKRQTKIFQPYED